ncbi:hypothetical protein MAPG_02117, partial [Magnaporthiopsis poae ATCC 64411]
PEVRAVTGELFLALQGSKAAPWSTSYQSHSHYAPRPAKWPVGDANLPGRSRLRKDDKRRKGRRARSPSAQSCPGTPESATPYCVSSPNHNSPAPLMNNATAYKPNYTLESKSWFGSGTTWPPSLRRPARISTATSAPLPSRPKTASISAASWRRGAASACWRCKKKKKGQGRQHRRPHAERMEVVGFSSPAALQHVLRQPHLLLHDRGHGSRDPQVVY